MKKVFHRDENVFSPRWKKIFMQHHVKPDHRHFFKVWRTRSDYEVYPTVSFVFAIPPESGWLALAAYQHRRKLGNAMLRKSERHVASSSPTLWGRKLRPQRSIFFFRQFKHKIAKQPLSSYLAIIHRGPTCTYFMLLIDTYWYSLYFIICWFSIVYKLQHVSRSINR